MAVAAEQSKNYVGGEWLDGTSGETFESRVPATGESLGSFPRSTAADVDRAVEAAKAAFEEWRLVPAPERGTILLRFARLLEDRKDELTELMSREMGKVLAEAGGDVQEAIDMSIYMAGEGRRMFGHTTPSELRDKFQMSVRMPVGVVGAITPWNFPIAIPAWKLAPALVCGNTVVLKPAEDTPLLAARFVELLGEAGLPDGVVNLVHGYGEEAGDRLVRHPDVPVITFTGSRETGVLVTKNAADQLKHVHLELGGKNGIIVMDDADLDLAVEGIVWSAFGTSGQRCTAASRVIVHEAVYGELQKRLVARAEAMRIGPGWDPETDLGPVINQESLDKIHSYTGIGADEGAKLLTGGEAGHRGRPRQGLLLPADDLRRRRPADADRAGGDLRPDDRADPVGPSTRRSSVANGIRYGLSLLDLHARREQGVPRDARPPVGDHLHQRRHDRAPRCTCPSAARRTPATATARPARRRSTSSRSGSRSTSTTPASCSARRSTTPSLNLVRGRLFTDGGARGNPGPAAYGYVLEAERREGARGARRGDRRRDEQRRRVQRPDRRAREGGRARRRRARGGLRLGADGQADAGRVQGQERGAARALAPGRPARPRARIGPLHGGPARAQQARRPARERGARRRRLSGAGRGDRGYTGDPRGCSSVG